MTSRKLVAIFAKVRRTSEVRRTCMGSSYLEGLADCLKGVGQGDGT
jgi:hypothetical protein